MPADKSKMGRLSRAAGQRFESVVRKDLEEKGWIVDRWTNNVEWPESNINLPSEERIGKLVPAKPSMVFNPIIKRRVPQGLNTGFPDFIALKPTIEKRPYMDEAGNRFDVIVYLTYGIEVKMEGILSREEKEKCEWLLESNKFSKILVARKTKVKNRIVVVYEDFEEIKKRMRK